MEPTVAADLPSLLAGEGALQGADEGYAVLVAYSSAEDRTPHPAFSLNAKSRSLSRKGRGEGRWCYPSILPGFKIPLGSSAVLIARIISRATGSFTCLSRSTFNCPMPCSADTEPPWRSTTS